LEAPANTGELRRWQRRRSRKAGGRQVEAAEVYAGSGPGELQDGFSGLDASRIIARKLARRLTGREREEGEGVIEPPIPPICPPGLTLGPPDFVGIGGQRCGTTRWFRLLASHPEVLPSPAAKELHYFDRFYTGRFTPDDAGGYRRYFPRRAGQKSGEWTPGYVAAPWVPPLLAASAPEARLLVLLRDPLERYLSGLKHDSWVADRAGLPLSQHAPMEAFARGLYHAQLMGWLAHFDRSQILILQYERCSIDPLTELQRTLKFIGISEDGFSPDLDAHPNHQPAKPPLDDSVREAYVDAYRDDVTRLAADFPEIDLSLWPNFAHLAR
jgi:hypothetical protein